MALVSVTSSLAKLLSTQQPDEPGRGKQNLHVGHEERQKKTEPQKWEPRLDLSGCKTNHLWVSQNF